jgi:hypothetical protein
VIGLIGLEVVLGVKISTSSNTEQEMKLDGGTIKKYVGVTLNVRN